MTESTHKHSHSPPAYPHRRHISPHSPTKRKVFETTDKEDGHNGHSTATTTTDFHNGNGHGHANSVDKKSSKRRKVNHACVYCRRSHMTCDLERPCARCVKRDIGHLCHDEPREPVLRRSKSEVGAVEIAPAGEDGGGGGDGGEGRGGERRSTMGAPIISVGGEDSGVEDLRGGGSLGGLGRGVGQVFGSVDLGGGGGQGGMMNGNGDGNAHTIAQPTTLSPTRLQHNSIPNNQQQQQQQTVMNSNSNTAPTIFDWNNAGLQNQFQDMHHLHPNYMFNNSEVTNEYNLLNDFLSNSLLDDGAMYNPEEAAQTLFSDPLLATSSMNVLQNNLDRFQLPPQQQQQPQIQPNLSQPQQQSQQNQHHPSLPPKPTLQSKSPLVSDTTLSNTATPDAAATNRARDKYFLTAADPAGLDSAQSRLHKLLKAKYDAGMLKPFNYIKGYARLQTYLKTHLPPASQRRILEQLGRFRPGFRAAMQGLSDVQLVLVEMWFERSLMEYDRVFASMAIPACCWRRTGEIFRGNREMAALLGVGLEKLRDGKLALHEIMEGESLVSYWEKFGAVAFDGMQKAVLTSCSLVKRVGVGVGREREKQGLEMGKEGAVGEEEKTQSHRGQFLAYTAPQHDSGHLIHAIDMHANER
ncbi:Transcription factor [Recurvomyces mirabilis]|uniref:Transcription factor n=1 Tax=Recurvomyces mirabilis TaxID=574656 RepID=A0AAE0WMD7_9PEZI|nr:Transcription factor [Recurvomyces mirabilis]KAK5154177.1 Transcription factor [Recurvomyces mirabilis]